jgi:hypothetical protein
MGKSIHVDFGAKPYKQREVMIPMCNYPTLPNWSPSTTVEDMFNKFNISGGGKTE